MDKVSYALGLNIGNNLLDAGIDKLEWDKFLKGVKDSMEKNDQEMTNQEAQQELNSFLAKLQADAEVKNSKQEKTFLDNNAKREEITALPSGLQYEILTAGDGAKPKATDKVKCHYEGTLIDGTVFDSSYRRGEPAVFGVNQVIAGWVEALQLMSVGSKWRLYIPYRLGYGEHGAGSSIPPYSTLIFDVERLEIIEHRKTIKHEKDNLHFTGIGDGCRRMRKEEKLCCQGQRRSADKHDGQRELRSRSQCRR